MTISLTWYRAIEDKNGGLNLVLWHAKSMLILTLKLQQYMTGIQYK